MKRVASLLTLTALSAACHSSPPSPEVRLACSGQGAPAQDAPAQAVQEVAPEPREPREPREADPMLDTGFVLRSHEGRKWGLRLSVPVAAGWTEFDLDNINLDNLTTLAAIPTAEFIVPIGERWTLLPFVGLGLALQLGDGELIGGDRTLGLATGGVRASRWQSFSERYWLGLIGEVRYNAALSSRDGVLGDWGSSSLAAELRRDFPPSWNGSHLQGGLYVQGFYFWDSMELEIAGVSPTEIDDHVEVGISLGGTPPLKLWGITVPRTFIGFLVGDALSGARIRFGRL